MSGANNDIYICFQENSNSLPAGGTSIEKAKWIGHPPLVYKTNDGAWSQPVGGNTAIKAYSQDQIYISMIDPSYGITRGFVPVKLVLYTFGPNSYYGSNPELNLSTINSGTEAPIGMASFSETYEGLPYFDYTGQSAWENAEDDFNPYGVEVKDDAAVKKAAIYNPYVNFQVLHNPGYLWYGIVFAYSKDGGTREYYGFDPMIQIISS